MNETDIGGENSKSAVLSENSETAALSGEELTALAAALLQDEEFVRKFVLGNETVERAVIDNYLRARQKTSRVLPGGSGTLAPLQRPKTLEEAKRICNEYLKDL